MTRLTGRRPASAPGRSPGSAGPPDGPGRLARRRYTVVVFVILASLDNAAISVVPPLLTPISAEFGVAEGMVGLVIAVSFLITAVAAVAWAYAGDRSDRRRLLMVGTLIWSAGTSASAVSDTFTGFLVAQAAAAVGLGAVGSVGFSVVSDLISPRRRGLVMSFWGLSQGAGTLTGTLVGGVLGAGHWRLPFLALAGAGAAATVAYLFTGNIRRGQSDPELAGVFAAGAEYEGRISRVDLPLIMHRRSNVWLTLQGLTAQMAFGSWVWLPRLFQARAEDQGYQLHTAIIIGSVFAALFQLGGVLSIIGGIVGDRLQRRTPRGRALVACAGMLASVPIFAVLFFLPVHIRVPDGASTARVVAAVLANVVTEPTVGFTLLLALAAVALTAANSPNWFALIAEVNLPEHRGTVYSLGNLVNGVGRASGTFLVGTVLRVLERSLPPPVNYAVGLAAFQLFFVPTGAMYWLASRCTSRDIASVHETLTERAAAALPPEPAAPVSGDLPGRPEDPGE